MPSVLIVDNSPPEREKTADVLREADSYVIDFADSAGDALSRIASDCPDIVLTDLLKPEGEGLQLVSQIRSEHPVVPVILVTDHGDEEVAVEALHNGAASYVPKRLLERYLAQSVRRLIDVSRDQRSRAKLLGSMKNNRSTFFLKNDLELIPTLVNYFQEGMSHMGLGDETDRIRVSVALEEALTNAIHHGNLEVDSRLRESDEGEYYACIRQRRNQPPFRDRQVEVMVVMTDEEATFTIRDEGPGFNVDDLPDPTDEEHLQNSSGRGILLMRSFMDSVIYNEVGNMVTMSKRRDSNGSC